MHLDLKVEQLDKDGGDACSRCIFHVTGHVGRAHVSADRHRCEQEPRETAQELPWKVHP